MNHLTYHCFDVIIDERKVAWVTLDVPDRPLNVLDRQAMEELHQIVTRLEADETIRLVVFRSGKESGFLAGADVAAIAEIDPAKEAQELLLTGQRLFDRVAQLPMPTLVVVHGPCLGGGLEWALACTYRLARDNSSTQLGLPEIKLGLIPGWGGTQRLPRRVGLREALAMILSGKHCDAKQAAAIGLVDRAIAPETWEAEIDTFIDGILSGHVAAADVQSGSLLRWLQESNALGRALVARAAHQQVAKKSRQYPALPAAIRAIAASYRSGIDGFAVERDEFTRLLSTPTCRRLLELFFAREKARHLATWSNRPTGTIHEDPIRQIGVVGGGAMGAGIAQLAALRGFDVIVKEVDDAAVTAAHDRIVDLIDGLGRRKHWNSLQRDSVLQRITVTTEKRDLAQADLIIEAVVEREDLKCAVLTEMDRVVQGAAIFATNTSSLSVDRMSAVVRRPAQMAGLHFFNPVHRMELVEVVRGEQTSDRTIAKLVALVRALGKTPIVTSDSPGFLVNRVLFPYLGEAVAMVGEGYDVRDIDRHMKRFGMPMGPCELLDQVGLDVALHVARSLSATLAGVQPVIAQLSTLTDQGHFGVKSGKGFYTYVAGKRTKPTVVNAAGAVQQAHDDFAGDGLTNTSRRLVYPMLREAICALEERVVQEAWAVDLAMVLGTGFSPHLGGPLHLVDSLGHESVLQNLERLQALHGERFTPPNSLLVSVDQGTKYFRSHHHHNHHEKVAG